ncbi:MAG: apolipoprotein N-acyltransferase [Geminicoccaceae bacterium]
MRAYARAARPEPIAAWLEGAHRRSRLVALGSGALAALALPPVHFWPALLGFAMLVHLVRRAERRRAAFVLGWCFGFGHFVVGLYWIAIAFFVDAERFGALAVPAVLLLCAGLAIFPGLAAWLVALRRWQSPSATALAFAVVWTGTEWLRGNFLWGFPWNLIGYAFASSDAVLQLASVTGIYGLSLLAALIGALPAALLEPGGHARWRPALASVLIPALLFAGGAVRLAGAPEKTVPGVELRLVQGNIAQDHKWQPELRARWFERYLELSARAQDGVTAVIWPESATPYPLERDAEARRLIGQVVPQGGLLLTGGERFDLASEPPRAWNSLFVLDGRGEILARYDKHELVPFGEFLPLRQVLGRIGLKKITEGTIDFQPGPGRETLRLPGLPPFSPLICYEAIFPGRVVDPDDRPDWLLNVTNDAWFGRSSGPYQHFAMARVRAVEEGLPLVRSANTGISAVVDPWGRVRAELGLGETGVLDAALPRPLGHASVFAAFRPWPMILLVGAAVAVLAAVERPRRVKY